MRAQLTWVVGWLCLWQCSYGQWQETGSAELSGLAHTGSAYVSNPWQVQFNPAAMVGVDGIAVGAGVAQHFLVKELSPVYLVAVVPFQDKHALGLGIRSMGFGGYRETLAGVAYAIDLVHVRLGARINAQVADFASYGTQTAWMIDAGIALKPVSQLWVAVWASNATASAYPAARSSPLPRHIKGGLSYLPSERLRVLLDVTLPDLGATMYGLGLTYTPTATAQLHIGLGTLPLSVTGGVSFRWERLWVRIATGYSTSLGATPVLSVEHTFQPGGGGE